MSIRPVKEISSAQPALIDQGRQAAQHPGLEIAAYPVPRDQRAHRPLGILGQLPELPRPLVGADAAEAVGPGQARGVPKTLPVPPGALQLKS